MADGSVAIMSFPMALGAIGKIGFLSQIYILRVRKVQLALRGLKVHKASKVKRATRD